MKKLFLVVVSCLMQLTHLDAQERRIDAALNYTTEWQTDFRRNANWVNLLRADVTVSLMRDKGHGGLMFEAATISTAVTRTESIIEDLQGFSNIEAEPIPLIPAVLSLAWQTESTAIHLGIRNINEEYFTSDVASFFTHSSNGIFPTLAGNFPIANYPNASVGLDFIWQHAHWSVNGSLYNGIGYNRWHGRENIFRFCPHSDGLFAACSLNHEAAYGNSHLGAALHHDGQRTRGVLWGYSEVGITPSTSLIAQYSLALGRELFCRHYAGAGVHVAIGEAEIGALTNLAWFADRNEWATEFSAKLPGSLLCRIESRKAVWHHFSLQPALHIIRLGRTTTSAALCRFTIAL